MFCTIFTDAKVQTTDHGVFPEIVNTSAFLAKTREQAENAIPAHVKEFQAAVKEKNKDNQPIIIETLHQGTDTLTHQLTDTVSDKLLAETCSDYDRLEYVVWEPGQASYSSQKREYELLAMDLHDSDYGLVVVSTLKMLPYTAKTWHDYDIRFDEFAVVRWNDEARYVIENAAEEYTASFVSSTQPSWKMTFHDSDDPTSHWSKFGPWMESVSANLPDNMDQFENLTLTADKNGVPREMRVITLIHTDNL